MVLKVATVGAGYFAQFHHEAWADEPRAELVAVCDADATKASAYAERYGAAHSFTDVDALLSAQRPDLLDIITPPASHAALIEKAAAAGIPVICQKAFCRSLSEAEAAVASAEHAGIMLVIHENFRFSPWYREIKRLIDAGHFGTVFQATYRMRPGDGRGERAYLDRQPYFQAMERFLVHETAIHLIDVFRYLFGEPVSVYADLRRLNPVIAGEDAGHILFDFGDGVRALFDGNRLSDHAAENRRLVLGEMAVEGEAGTLALTGDGDLTWRAFGTDEAVPHPYAWNCTGFAGNAVAALQAHVLDHLIDGTPLHNTGCDYLANLRIEDAVYRSAATGTRITLR